jgi:hypothetical protein
MGMSMDKWIDKNNNEILLNLKKEGNFVTYYSVDELKVLC